MKLKESDANLLGRLLSGRFFLVRGKLKNAAVSNLLIILSSCCFSAATCNLLESCTYIDWDSTIPFLFAEIKQPSIYLFNYSTSELSQRKDGIKKENKNKIVFKTLPHSISVQN